MASAGAATVEKALDVLFHLHDANASLGLSEIGRALDLPKSSCHRLLVSLVNREIVERDDAGHYRPGLALLSLGIGAQSREPVVSAARPVLEGSPLKVVDLPHLVALKLLSWDGVTPHAKPAVDIRALLAANPTISLDTLAGVCVRLGFGREFERLRALMP